MQYAAILVAAVVLGALVALVHPVAPLAAIVAVLLGALALSSPYGMLLGFIGVLFTRPGELFPVLAQFQLAKLFALGAFGLFLAGKLLGRDLSWVQSRLNMWMGALTFGVFLSIIDSTDRALSMSFFTDVFVRIAIFWILMVNLIERRSRSVSFQVFVSMLVAFLGGYALYLKMTGQADIEGSRAGFVGLIGDPNDLALTLLVAMPFLVEATLTCRGAQRVGFALLLALVLGGIISTQSRGGLLAAGAAGYILLLQRIPSRVVVGAFMAAGLVGLLIVSGVGERATVSGDAGGLDASAAGRLDAWVAAIRMFIFNPFNGVGLNQVFFNYGNYAWNPRSWIPITTHNSYLQAMAETGLVGIVPFTALIIHTVRINMKLRNAVPDDATPLERAVLRSQLANFVGVGVAASFLSVAWLWFPYVLFAFAAANENIWLSSYDDRPAPAPSAPPPGRAGSSRKTVRPALR